MEKATSQMAEAQFPFHSLFLFLSLLPSLASLSSSLSFFRKKGFFFFISYVLWLHVCKCTMCLPVSLEKEMQTVVSYQVGAGTKPRSSARAQELQVLSTDESSSSPFFSPLVRENSLQSPSLLSSNRKGFLTLNTFERLMLSKVAIFPIVTERGFFFWVLQSSFHSCLK